MQHYVSTYSTYECSLCICIHSLCIIGASELYSTSTTILPSFIKTSDSIFEIMFYILSTTYFTGTPRLMINFLILDSTSVRIYLGVFHELRQDFRKEGG